MKVRLMGPFESVTVMDGNGNAITVFMRLDGTLSYNCHDTGAIRPDAGTLATHDTAPLENMRQCTNRKPHLLSECPEPRDGTYESKR